MPDYILEALEENHPCGVSRKGKIETHCNYTKDCSAFGKSSGGCLCISRTAYQFAKGLLKGGKVESEREGLLNFAHSNIDKKLVDPEEDKWNPRKWDKEEASTIVNKIIERGQEMYNSASSIGSQRNPINFDCSPEDMLRDLSR